MHRIYLIALMLLVTGLQLKAQLPLVKRIDSVMQLANSRGIFNGNILVAKGAHVIFQRSLGYADGSRTNKLTADRLFDIGSVSKEFNGTAIMLLQERGLLNINEPVSKYLPGLPNWASRVKIRHLISYTSGIPPFSATSSETDSLMQANLLGLKELKFEPGTAYLYNHYNVYLQMRIIEKVSGVSYARFITQNILKPCGMTSAVVDLPTSDPKMAKTFDNEYRPTAYEQGMSGWVRLSIADLYKWTECLHQYKVISKASFATLATNFAGGESSLGTIGFEGEQLIWHQHQGSNSNFEAMFYSNLKDSVTIVMMTNSQQMKVFGIRTAIINVLKNEPVVVPKKSVYLQIRETALANADKGLALYQDIKANQQDRYDLSFEIGDLISTGKYLQRRNKLNDAIRFFATAVALPGKPADISYGYELIGECYLKSGDMQKALANYQTAVTTYPNNKNAQGMIDHILKSK